MDLFKDLITAFGIDKSFFYQLAIVVGTYFLSKHLFLKAYCDLLEKRRKQTQGKMADSLELEKQTKELQITYEKEAYQLNQDFQSVFAKIKQAAEATFVEQKNKLQQQRDNKILEQRENLFKAQQTQAKELNKDLPSLAQSLVDKLKGFS